MSETLALRGRVASLSRSRSANDPDLIEARRALAAEKLAAYVAKTVADAPPLTDAQRDRIAALLCPTKARDAQ